MQKKIKSLKNINRKRKSAFLQANKELILDYYRVCVCVWCVHICHTCTGMLACVHGWPEGWHVWFTQPKCFCLLPLSLASVSSSDWTETRPGTELDSGLGRDQAHEGWALDLPPGCRSAAPEYEEETLRTGAQHCTEHGFPSEGRN